MKTFLNSISFLFLLIFVGSAKAEVHVKEPHSGEEATLRTRASSDRTDFFSFRERHRLGVGLSVGSYSGMAGGGLDLNLSGSDAAVVNVGGGETFTAISGGWKHYLVNSSVSPYFSVGYSRWNQQGKTEITKTNPTFLYDRLLTAEEKEKGVFTKDMVFATGGLQYTMLSGSYQGCGGYLEVAFLTSIRPLEFVPTVGFGFTYLL